MICSIRMSCSSNGWEAFIEYFLGRCRKLRVSPRQAVPLPLSTWKMAGDIAMSCRVSPYVSGAPLRNMSQAAKLGLYFLRLRWAGSSRGP